jgi:hypothetical protein
MTAVVGILNKRAIAIAADSAATIQGINSTKILNDSNKIFTLSKHHPVGVMIYNSASFLATPWETIIKVYRKQLGNRSFPTLKEYQVDFIKFLHDKSFYSDEATQKLFIYWFLDYVTGSLIQQALKGHEALLAVPVTPENRLAAITLIEAEFDTHLKNLRANTEICPEFADLTQAEFNAFIPSELAAVIKNRFTDNGFTLTPQFLVKIREALFLYVRIKESFSTFTGLVFVGFGEDEIYPSLIPVQISFAHNTRLRYFVQEELGVTISNQRASAIAPFGQSDVITTILMGVDPTLDNTYKENIQAIFSKYNSAVLKIVDGSAELKAQIEAVDLSALMAEYDAKMSEAVNVNYINPLFNALESLSKDDLAEMAESLIYLTYLKRRITNAEESVGGPVDVAIISKGDGFIWIKRKFYFKPELNQYFFDNYLK